MYLSELFLTNFRSCDRTIVQFHEELTILAGENNAGKTNVIDGLRLLTSPSDGRRSRYPDPADVRRGSGDSFELSATFAGLTGTQRGLLITALTGPSDSKAVLGMHYRQPGPGERRGAQTRTVSPRRAPESEGAARELIRHVHLPALRDANRELASGSPGRIAFLLRLLSTPGEQQDLLDKIAESHSAAASHPVIGQTESQIRGCFGALTLGVQEQVAHLGFEDPTLLTLARDLRFRLGLAGLDPTDLSESGLGYANLLSLATVVMELRAAKDADLTLFLVEEPEAHLHPQLQAVTLAYLRQQAADSAKATEGGEPAGRIQVIVSSHSPNLTSAISARHLVVLRSTVPAPAEDTPVGSATMSPASGATVSPSKPKAVAPPLPATRGVSVATLGISREALDKIDRYLDVTRSALLFSRRVLLVEGLGEAILVPAFGERLFAGDARSLARLRAATIVPIDGVDFEPYVRLLLTPCSVGKQRIADRVAIITDEDPTADAEEIDGSPTASGAYRRTTLTELATSLGASTSLLVELSPMTLEGSLLGDPPDPVAEAGLRQVFLDCHPRSGKRWRTDVELVPPTSRAAALVHLLTMTRTRKGDFAQRLAAHVRTGPFPVPLQFARALRFIIED